MILKFCGCVAFAHQSIQTPARHFDGLFYSKLAVTEHTRQSMHHVMGCEVRVAGTKSR